MYNSLTSPFSKCAVHNLGHLGLRGFRCHAMGDTSIDIRNLKTLDTVVRYVCHKVDIVNIELVADITHYCVKGLEVPYIRGHIAHGMKEEDTKPQVAKVVYGALGKLNKR